MSGLTTIKLSSEDLKKEQERQRKRGRLIFKTFKKGKVKVVVGRYDEDGTVPDMIFQYQIHDAHFRSIVDYTNGEVICVMDCYYDDIDIFNEDGSEITEKLPLWLLSEIENKIEDKFASFNIELRYMQQSDGKGKKSLVNESEKEDQKLINKVRVVYKAHKNGSYKFKYGKLKDRIRLVKWSLPPKFSVKIKHYNQEDSEKYGYENYLILILNSKSIKYITTDGEDVTSGEKMVIGSRITENFKNHGITIYWSEVRGDEPFPNRHIGVLPDDEYTHIDISPK
jgi:hypothetical protein